MQVYGIHIRPKGFPHTCFEAQVYTVQLHSPIGRPVLTRARNTAALLPVSFMVGLLSLSSPDCDFHFNRTKALA